MGGSGGGGVEARLRRDLLLDIRRRLKGAMATNWTSPQRERGELGRGGSNSQEVAWCCGRAWSGTKGSLGGRGGRGREEEGVVDPLEQRR